MTCSPTMAFLAVLALVATSLQGQARASSPERWFVRGETADVRSEPADGAERVTQAHPGTEVVVIEQAGDWAKVRIPAQGNYPGWMRTSDLVPARKAQAFASARQLAVVRVARTSVLESASSGGRAVAEVTLGAILGVPGRCGGFVRVVVPGGDPGYVRDDAVAVYDRDGTPPRRGTDDIISTAMQLVGVPYLWGGMGVDGVDCSGFVYTVFYVNGVVLPRDAHEQYQVGVPVDRHHLRPGDLVFYSTYAAGPSHVGIYIGEHRVIQSGSGTGGVAVIDLDDPHYGPKYIGARRVIGAKGR